MIGFPKHFNCRQDYYNIIRMDVDRARMVGALQQLVNTATRPEAIWPEGYDPAHPDTATPPAAPVGWQTIDNPGGTIFLIGFTLEAVADLRRIVEELQPMQDKINEMANYVKYSEFAAAEVARESLALDYVWLPPEIATALANYGAFETAIINENYQTALGIVADVQLRMIQQMDSMMAL